MKKDFTKGFQRLQGLLQRAWKLANQLELPETVKDAPVPYNADDPSRYPITPYNRGFALYDGDQLVVVAMYKRGAEEVRQQLLARDARIAELTHALAIAKQGSPENSGAVARLQAERDPSQSFKRHR